MGEVSKFCSEATVFAGSDKATSRGWTRAGHLSCIFNGKKGGNIQDYNLFPNLSTMEEPLLTDTYGEQHLFLLVCKENKGLPGQIPDWCKIVQFCFVQNYAICKLY